MPMASIGVGVNGRVALLMNMPMRGVSPSIRGVTVIACSMPSRRMRNATGPPFCLPIASLTIELNTMRWPSTARMRSPALNPAASEGDPG